MRRTIIAGIAMGIVLMSVVVGLARARRAPAAADGGRWGSGYFPNVTLTTQDGTPVRFYDDLVKGKIVAISLIYTTCKYACPLETARMAQVAKLLGDRMGRDVFFYSITIDPEHDTPQVLKAYAEKFHAGPGWMFLTGKASDIELISRKLGLYSEPNPNNPDGHTPALLIGNEATGQWMRNGATDNAKFLARTIGDWLNSWQTAKKPTQSYATVPALNLDAGEYGFRTHCAACHTIGGGDNVGPDLRDVTTRRDRVWLSRFIAAPDRLLAEGDPAARALVAKYQQALMPNLGLSRGDADLLIDFMAKQSRAVAAATASAAVRASAAGGTLAPVMTPYLGIQRALSADRIDGIRDRAAEVGVQAAKLGPDGAAMQAAASEVQRAGDLVAARAAFSRLSDAILSCAKRSGRGFGEAVTIAYCPMAHKYWLQKGEQVRNPFLGTRMVECGRITADIPSLTN